ncbi:choice-of-anchor Q domain-containing protein [Marinibactrum halimedae]|uniref:Uncharacterized protein n=1 Tax=Marinibactrum halimedae TaxID=1444977 RepID=A0AA37T8T0_9GAMM|nr:choice-of-anchor Q domain-containing protein [Marinibactrum halimedae]MCD9458839.1 hypothetical protein [Marinibactrum halimedae]GLS27691.1 hypothetical protein GCM10007877_34100 [Marinibactrum halimedae]
MPIFVVTTLADENPYDLDEGIQDAGLSLRDAIHQAHLIDEPSTIIFDPSLAGGAISLFSQLLVAGDITINGDIDGDGFPDIVIDAGGHARVFLIDDGEGDQKRDVVLEGLVITGGFHSNSEVKHFAGGVTNRENLTIKNSVITNNVSLGNAGGIFNEGDLAILHTSVSNNRSGFHGGGVMSGNGELIISDSTFDGNAAEGSGGGLLIASGDTQILNSTFSGNDGDVGGAISSNGANVIVTGSTLTGNNAKQSGGGIKGMVTLHNSIVSGNSAPNETNIGAYSGSHNVVDAVVQKDDGVVQKDIGAFESQQQRLPGVVVTTLNDVIDPHDDKISLREAINSINDGRAIGPITFDPGIVGRRIKLTLGELVISRDVVIDGDINGDGMPDIIIDGQKQSRVFKVDDNDSTITRSIALKGLIITGGDAANQAGGGIYSAENLELQNTVITQNTARYGGGIFVASGSLLIQASEIRNNNALVSGGGISTKENSVLHIIDSTIKANHGKQRSGGIYSFGETIITGSHITHNSTEGYGGGISNANIGSLTITESTISNNHAKVGGGIENNGNLSVSNSAVVRNNSLDWAGGIFNRSRLDLFTSTIADNTSTTGAGGIHNKNSGELSISNTTISGNSATGQGGGIYSENTDVEITNTIVSGNQAKVHDNINQYNNIGDNNNLIDVSPETLFADINPVTGGGMLADNGGSTQTIALNRDANNAALDAAEHVVGEDQRGEQIYDADSNGTSSRDIGAFESQVAAIDYVTIEANVNGEVMNFQYHSGTSDYIVLFPGSARVTVQTSAPIHQFGLVPNGDDEAMVWALTEEGFIEVTAINRDVEPDEASSVAVMSMIHAQEQQYVAMEIQPDGSVNMLDSDGYLYRFAVETGHTTLVKTAEPVFAPEVINSKQPAKLTLLANGQFSLSQDRTDDASPFTAASRINDPHQLDTRFGIVRLDNGQVLKSKDGGLFELNTSGQWQKLPGLDLDNLEHSTEGALSVLGNKGVALFAENGTRTEEYFDIDNAVVIAAGRHAGTTYALDSQGVIHFQGALTGSLLLTDASLSDIAVTAEGIWGITIKGEFVQVALPVGNGDNQVGPLTALSEREFLSVSLGHDGQLNLLEYAGGDTHYTNYEPQSANFTLGLATDTAGIFNANFRQASGIHLTSEGIAYSLSGGELQVWDPRIEDWLSAGPSELNKIKVGADGKLYGLYGDNVIVALDRYGNMQASDLLSENLESWKAKAITTLGTISDFSVAADGTITFIDQNNQLLKIPSSEQSWVSSYYGSTTNAKTWKQPFAVGESLEVENGKFVNVAQSAQLASGERLIVTDVGEVYVGLVDEFEGQTYYDYTLQRWPGKISSLSVSEQGVFLADVETLQGDARKMAFAGEWREVSTPLLVEPPKAIGLDTTIVSHAVDAEGATWVLDNKGNLFRQADNTDSWSQIDTGNRHFETIQVNVLGNIMVTGQNGERMTPTNNTWQAFNFGAAVAEGPTNFNEDFDNLALGRAPRFKGKTEILGVKHKGKFIGSGLNFGQWFRTHVANGVFYKGPSGKGIGWGKGSEFYSAPTDTKKEFIQSENFLYTTPFDKINSDQAGQTELLNELNKSGNELLSDLDKSLNVLISQLGVDEAGWNNSSLKQSMATYRDRHLSKSARQDLVPLIHDYAKTLFGENHEITRKINEKLINKGVFANPTALNEYGAIFAQITQDLATSAQVSDLLNNQNLPDGERNKNIDQLLKDRKDSLIALTRKSGMHRLESTGHIVRGFDYFQTVIQNPYHRVSRQFKAYNISNADDLKTKLRGMKTGDTITISSGWYHGGEVKTNFGTTFLNPADTFFGGTAYAGGGVNYNYSISFKKIADGNVEVSMGRDKSHVLELGVDVYTDATLLNKIGDVEIYPEFDLSIDYTRDRKLRDGLNMTIGAESLEANSTDTFFDRFFNQSLKPESLLDQANGGVSGEHKNVLKVTLDASIEASLLPYKGHSKVENEEGARLVSGSVYGFLPGLGAEASITLYSSEKASSFDTNNANAKKTKQYQGFFTKRSYNFAARLGFTNRWRANYGPEFVTPIENDINAKENSDGSEERRTVNMGFPVYTKGAANLIQEGWDSDEQKRLKRDSLRPDHNFYRIDAEKGELNKVSWSVSAERDYRLLEIPLIKELLEGKGAKPLSDAQRQALREDLVQLVSFTTKENRVQINTDLGDLKAHIDSLTLSNSERRRANKLLLSLDSMKEFMNGGNPAHPNEGGGNSDKHKFFNTLSDLDVLIFGALPQSSSDSNVIKRRQTKVYSDALRERLTDDSLWTKHGPDRGRSVSISVQMNDKALKSIDMSQSQSNVHNQIKNLFKDGNNFQVNGISASESRSRNTKFAFSLLYKTKTEATRSLSRSLGSISLSYGENSAVYNQAKTTGHLFSDNNTDSLSDSAGDAPLTEIIGPRDDNLEPQTVVRDSDSYAKELSRLSQMAKVDSLMHKLHQPQGLLERFYQASLAYLNNAEAQALTNSFASSIYGEVTAVGDSTSEQDFKESILKNLYKFIEHESDTTRKPALLQLYNKFSGELGTKLASLYQAVNNDGNNTGLNRKKTLMKQNGVVLAENSQGNLVRVPQDILNELSSQEGNTDFDKFLFGDTDQTVFELTRDLSLEHLARIDALEAVSEADIAAVTKGSGSENEIMSIIDKLRTRKLSYVTMTSAQEQILYGFFPSADGKVDKKKVRHVVRNPSSYRQFQRDLILFNSLDPNDIQGITPREAINRARKTIVFERTINEMIAQNSNAQSTQSETDLPIFNNVIVDQDSQSFTRPRHSKTSSIELAKLALIYGGNNLMFSTSMALANTKVDQMVVNLQQYGLTSQREALQITAFHEHLEGIARASGLLGEGQIMSLDDTLSALQNKTGDSYFQLISGDHMFAVGKKVSVDSQGNATSNYFFLDPSIEKNLVSTNKDITALKNEIENYLSLRSTSGVWDGILADHYGLQSQGDRYQFSAIEFDPSALADNSDYRSLQNIVSTVQTDREILASAQTSLTIAGVEISLETLYDMGAIIDGERISVDSQLSPDHIRYNPQILADYLARPDGRMHTRTEQAKAVKLLKQQISDQNYQGVLSGEGTFEGYRLLKLVDKNVSADGAISNKLWSSITGNALQTNNLVSDRGRFAGTIDRLDKLSFGLGSIQSVMAFVNYARRKQNGERIGKAEERDIAILGAGLGVELASPVIEGGLSKLGTHIAGKTTDVAKGGKWLSRNVGKLLSKGGALLSILSAPLDIYGAVTAFKQLDNDDLTSNQRQDLIVSGSLSVAGAALSIAVGVAIIAGAGVALASGVGAVLGAALLIGGGIYSGVRAVQDIKERVSLDVGQKIKEGFRGFFGLGPSEATMQRIKNSYLPEAEAQANQPLYDSLEISNLNMLAQDNESENGRLGGVVFTYTNGVKLDHRDYQKITLTEFPDAPPNSIAGGVPHKVNIDHLPFETEGLRQGSETETAKEQVRQWAQQNIDSNHTFVVANVDDDEAGFYFIQDGEIEDAHDYYHYSNQGSVDALPYLTNYNDIITENGYDLSGLDLSSLTHRREGTWGSIIRNDFDVDKDFMLYNMGEGNDRFFAQLEYKSVFTIYGTGQKFVVGGNKDDAFMLYNKELDAPVFTGQTSIFDGKDGNDTLIVEGTRSQGNHIELNDVGEHFGNHLFGTAKESYVADQIVYIVGIENIQGAVDAQDTIIGNGAANVIDGRGGNDIIDGGEGDDLISLYHGDKVDGGKGNDTYFIRRREATTGSIEITEFAAKEESNGVVLDYLLEQIEQTKLVQSDSGDYDIHISLQNGDAGVTTLILKSVYAADLSRNDINFTLTTKDGFYLIPQFNSDLNDISEFKAEFAARYISAADQTLDAEFVAGGVQISIDAVSGTLTKNGATTIVQTLPDNMHLIAEGSSHDDLVLGTSGSDVVRGYAGNDDLTGAGGDDVYVVALDMEEINDLSLIPENFNVTDTGEKIIRNVESGIVQLDENGDPLLDADGNQVKKFGEDYLIYGAKREDIGLRQDGNDIVLYYKPDESRAATVRIKDFMVGQEYRHISLMDAEGVVWGLEIDENGTPYITEGVLTGTQQNDELIGPKDTAWIFTGDGDDSITAQTYQDEEGVWQGGDVIDAGGGDDMLIDSDGDNTLLGGDGDDEFIIKGGDDLIMTGQGYDHIDLSNATGVKVINAYAEEFTLNTITTPFDFTSSDVVFMRQEDNLFIQSPVDENGEATLTIILTGYFANLTNQRTHLRFGEIYWDSETLLARALYVEQTEVDDFIRLSDRNFTNVDNITAEFDALQGHDVIIDVEQQQSGVTHILRGASGDDNIYGGDGRDMIYGGEGHDELHGEEGDDHLQGGGGNDLLVDYQGTNILSGGNGDDEIYGKGELNGEAGSDVLIGSDSGDTLRAGHGVDDTNILIGYGGNDSLQGGSGRDIMNGGAGDDNIFGADGNDLVYASTGLESYHGGNDHDVLSFEEMEWSIEADFNGLQFNGIRFHVNSAGKKQVSGFEEVIGSQFDDKLTLGKEVFILKGGVGNDTLISHTKKKDFTKAQLHGGIGNDDYFVTLSAGETVTLVETDGYDTLNINTRFALNHDVSDIWFELNNETDDLHISMKNTSGEDAQIIIEDYASETADKQVEEVIVNEQKLVLSDIDLLISHMANHQRFDVSANTGEGKSVQQRIHELWQGSELHSESSKASDKQSDGANPALSDVYRSVYYKRGSETPYATY